jgi:PAS domain S-box-containing protein
MMEELAEDRQQTDQLETTGSRLASMEDALRESEARFRLALQNSDIVVYKQDRDLSYTWIYNPQPGFNPEDIVGKTDSELLLPEDAAPLERIKRQVLESGRGTRQTVRTTIDGRAYYYDLTVEPLRDVDGDIIGVTGASRDITEQVLVELERDATLGVLQARTRELGERVKELHCLYALSRLREKPGISLQEIYQGTAELIPPAWQHSEIAGARVVMDGQEYRTDRFCEQAACQQAADIIVYGQVSGVVEVCYSESQPDCDEGPFLTEERSLLDAIAERLGRITEHKRTERALRRQALEVAVLEERARLSRDLHDSVTQSLYSITLLAEGWKRLERDGRLEDSEDPFNELGEIAQQALKEMRLLVHELRPPDLEDVGLVGALHQRLGAVEKRAGVDTRLVADDRLEVPPQMEKCLYRIAIEALNNTLKHAGATSVEVRLCAGEDVVELEVVDDGDGFDLSTQRARQGFGLQGMRERVARLGGDFLVDSSPSGGTRVWVSVGTGHD